MILDRSWESGVERWPARARIEFGVRTKERIAACLTFIRAVGFLMHIPTREWRLGPPLAQHRIFFRREYFLEALFIFWHRALGHSCILTNYCRFTRERSISVSCCLRRRTLVGVISRYSSSAITSSPRSIVNSKGGTRLIASSAPRERMLVSCLPLVGLTIISSPLEVLPITMPSYTSTAGPMYKTPRSCKFQSENPSGADEAIDIMEPTLRRRISPTCGLKPTTREERMPSPLVSS